MFLGLDGLAGEVGVAKYMPTGHLLWNLVGHHSRVEAITRTVSNNNYSEFGVAKPRSAAPVVCC